MCSCAALHDIYTRTPVALQVFEEYLPLKHKNVLKPASAAGADDAYERKAAANLKLWK